MRCFMAILASWLLIAPLTEAASTPKPTKSDYLVTTGAGFLMSAGEGLKYGMNYELRKDIAQPLYVIALFENPGDMAAPMRAELVVAAGSKDFQLQSPPFKTIRHDTKYEVVLQLYSDSEHTQLLGTHKQMVLFNVPPAYEAMLEDKMGIEIL